MKFFGNTQKYQKVDKKSKMQKVKKEKVEDEKSLLGDAPKKRKMGFGKVVAKKVEEEIKNVKSSVVKAVTINFEIEL